MEEPDKRHQGEYQRRGSDTDSEVDWQGFGMRARASGTNTIMVVVLVALFGVIGFLIWDHDRKSVQQVAGLTAGQQHVIDEVAALTYVMTLTVEERGRLNLEMPEGLRRKLKDQR